MNIDPKCRNSQGETLALASLPFYGDCEPNMRLNMTTQPTISSERANQCRTRFGFARPFASLPISMKEKITFDHLTGLALWRADAFGHEPPPYWVDALGHEPPPYWVDENGDIHNL